MNGTASCKGLPYIFPLETPPWRNPGSAPDTNFLHGLTDQVMIMSEMVSKEFYVSFSVIHCNALLIGGIAEQGSRLHIF